MSSRSSAAGAALQRRRTGARSRFTRRRRSRGGWGRLPADQRIVAVRSRAGARNRPSSPPRSVPPRRPHRHRHAAPRRRAPFLVPARRRCLAPRRIERRIAPPPARAAAAAASTPNFGPVLQEAATKAASAPALQRATLPLPPGERDTRCPGSVRARARIRDAARPCPFSPPPTPGPSIRDRINLSNSTTGNPG